MRVLHLTAGNLFGGIESSLLTLARFAREYPALDLQFAACFPGRFADQLRAGGSTVHMLGGVRIRWPWTIWRARRRLARMLAQVRPDVAICHGCWLHVLFAPVVRSRRVPLAFWAHDAYRGRTLLERWSRRTPPDLIIANSRFSQSHLDNLFPGVRSQAIHQPVPPPPPFDHPANRSQIREALQTPAEAVVIAQTSRLEPWKGHGLLLDALGQLTAVPSWTCWIAGGAQRPSEEAYLTQLRRQADALGIGERIRYLGQRRDIPKVLAAADIHCQPNTGPEPFGVAFVEALHAGLPVVTTALGGALEIVSDECGTLVPPARSDALAAALLRLIEDEGLRRHLGGNGPQRALSISDPTQQVGKIAAALSSLTPHPVTA